MNQTPVELNRRTTVALLVYLAVTNHLQSRAAIAALLWPDAGQSQAYKALRRDLALLTQAIGKHWFVITRDSIGLNLAAAPWVDVHHFQQWVSVSAADTPIAYKKAIALYQDDFLRGFTLPASPPFDEWQFFQTEQYRQTYALALGKLVQHHTEQADYPTAISYAQRRLALDALHEPTHRMLMQLYTWSDQQAAALRQYDECVRLLAAELDAPPAAETVQLYGMIKARRLALPNKPQPTPALSPPVLTAARLHNLPLQTTSFVGRTEEVAEIRSLILMEPTCRLLTLIGLGGIGKTRLALAVAQSLLETSLTPASAQAPAALANRLHLDDSSELVEPYFADGLFFVPLASVTTSELVVSAIAEALTLTFSGAADRKVQLFTYLRPKCLLLVLDNLEQVNDVADLLIEMLAASPMIKLLITSRVRLNLQEEWGMDVNTLAFPRDEPGTQGNALEMLESYEAVQLFVARARHVQSSFQLNHAEAAYIVRICQLVGGMPLGLELAATWLRVLSCREIAQEIAQNLNFLATSLRNIPPRHRSLRAVFEQSWQMLTEQEQVVFKQLAVFQGGFTREAVQAVTSATLPQLATLVDKSLLRYVQDNNGQGRYQIHELLRQFAAEKLQQVADEQDIVQTRHAEFYTAWLGSLKKDITSGRQFEILDAIAVEMANVRASWQWATQQGKVDTINRSLLTFARFCNLRGYAQEGATLCIHTLEQLQQGSDMSDPARIDSLPFSENQTASLICLRGWLSAMTGQLDLAHKLFSVGITQLRQLGATARPHLASFLWYGASALYFDGQYARANDYLHESHTLFTALADNSGLVDTLGLLGLVAESQSAFKRAQSLLQTSIQRYDAEGEQGYRAYCANALGRIATLLGDYVQAEQTIHEALAVRRRIRDRTGVALSLSALGYTWQAIGRWTEAMACHQESVDLHLETGNVLWAAFSRNDLAGTLLGAGHVAQARQLSVESLTIFQQREDTIGMANCLYTLGKIARHNKEFATAQRLFGESLALHRALGAQYQVALSLSELGKTALAIDEFATAQHCWHEALKTATELETVPLILELLVGWATLLQRGGDGVPAVELLIFAEQHIASTSATKEIAYHLRATLEAKLPAEVMHAAKQRVAICSLQEYVAEVLALAPDPIQ